MFMLRTMCISSVGESLEKIMSVFGFSVFSILVFESIFIFYFLFVLFLLLFSLFSILVFLCICFLFLFSCMLFCMFFCNCICMLFCSCSSSLHGLLPVFFPRTLVSYPHKVKSVGFLGFYP